VLLFQLLDDLLVNCFLLFFAEKGIVAFLEQNIILVALLLNDKKVVFFIVIFFSIEFFKHILGNSLFDIFWGLEFLYFVVPILTIFLSILLL